MQRVLSANNQLTSREAFNIFIRGCALVMIAVIVERALGAIDLAWDVISYHLPFIALRMGFISSDDYGLAPGLQLYFDGFPALLDYMRGVIWYVTGMPEAMNLLGLASVLSLALYLRSVWNVSSSWAFIAFMAVPAVHTAITSNYTDVISNVAVTVVILCCCEALLNEEIFSSKSFWVRIGLAALVAGNSKLQISFITALALGSLFLILIYRIWRPEFATSRLGWRQVAAFLAVSVISAYTMIENTWAFGNPVYPVAVTIGSWTLNGSYKGGESYFPNYLMGSPQWWRWLVSVIEYRALELRIPTYSQGMGEVPEGTPSSRMGGFLGMFAVFLFLLLVKLTLIERKDGGLRLFIAFVITTIVCANLPSSHESRYYLTWMLLLISLVFVRLRQIGDYSLAYSFKAAVVAAFVFVTSVTGGAYFTAQLPTDKYLIDKYASFLTSLPDGVEICASDNVRMAILASRLFQAHSSHRVETGSCAPGSVVLP